MGVEVPSGNDRSAARGPPEGLRTVNLKTEYNTEEDDLIADLYAPCLQLSEKYDRAVGYFRANIYRELGEDLLDFVVRGGRVRLVCSPDLPEPEESAAREGYALRGTRSESEQDATLVHVLNAMARVPEESDCLDMLRLLIERKSLELLIAVRTGGIFHRKLGAFYDPQGNYVVFTGSGNETARAVSSVEDWANDEQFDVYRSWGDTFESVKARAKADYLNTLIGGGTRHTKVRPLNEVETKLLAGFRRNQSLESCRAGARARTSRNLGEQQYGSGFSLYWYQREAVEAWIRAGRVGLMCMATGTGKTITALFAMKELLESGRPIVVLVPSKILLDQWHDDLRAFYPGVPILIAGGGFAWKSNESKRGFVTASTRPRIILATMHTASSDDFRSFLQQVENPVLIADEAHRLGSPKFRRVLEIRFRERLGLSATPERLFDREGSEILAAFFGPEPVFNLPLGANVRVDYGSPIEVPIIGHFLCPYEYDFKTVDLSAEEQKHWDDLTREVGRTIARDPSLIKDGSLSQGMGNRLQQLLIQRSRIIKNAKAKVECASRVVSEMYPEGGRWIVYCDNESQLNVVASRIRAEHPHVTILTYHSRMTRAERDRTLAHFEENPSIIVSIRCLDEGVNIRAADGALILASSTNPREYIQRRGRILRMVPGKKTARIIDTIVLPANSSEEDNVPFSIVRSELARAWHFANLAENKDVTHDLWKICMDYRVLLESDGSLSFPEDDSEE